MMLSTTISLISHSDVNVRDVNVRGVDEVVVIDVVVNVDVIIGSCGGG